MQSSITNLNHALEIANLWLKELKEVGQFHSEEEAYSALRAVIHSLRDRLIPTEAVNFVSEMPLLIKGVYYDGWKPANTPNQVNTQIDFLSSVSHNLRNAANKLDPTAATRAVFNFLNKKISTGGISHAKSELPRDILALWP